MDEQYRGISKMKIQMLTNLQPQTINLITEQYPIIIFVWDKFDFEPKLVIVTGIGGGTSKYQDMGFFVYGAGFSFGTGASDTILNRPISSGTGGNGANKITWGETTIHWYTTRNMAEASSQFNANGTVYQYFAIG